MDDLDLMLHEVRELPTGCAFIEMALAYFLAVSGVDVSKTTIRAHGAMLRTALDVFESRLPLG